MALCRRKNLSRRRIPFTRAQLSRYVPFLIAAAALTGALGAENRALLIGVPQVPGVPEMNLLEGPENDVASLNRMLIDDWGFRGDTIRTLVGSSATRTAILESLDLLIEETTAGDRVLVYFSGHGVSVHARETRDLGMRPDTGALVPADLKRGSPAETLAGLIVGSRDLRPRFERLDRTGAETLVLFDACYSGDSARRPPQLVARSGNPFAVGSDAEQAFDKVFAESLASAAAKWPYERIVYISAAARHELAWDIPSVVARGERPTIDGLAHGAFTNGLLLALRGRADRNLDGRIVYSELQEYLVGSLVSHRDSQTPQLHPAGKPITEMPVLGRAVVPARPGEDAVRDRLRVRLRARDPELELLLSQDDGVIVTAGEYDLEVRRRPGRFRVYLANGAELGVSLPDRTAVAALLKRRARARRIANLSYPAQDMRLEILLEPEQGGIYWRGDVLSVAIRPGERAWLLLLAIDSAGGVLPIYPFNPAQARPARSGETTRAVELAVVAPFGTELLEAFAFRDKPAMYDDWIGRTEQLSVSESDLLYRMLQEQADSPGRARASRFVYTLDR